MVSQKTGDKRLLVLAAFLRTLKRERFNYSEWVGSDWQGASDLSCGTQACALGWATTIPAFRRLGLRLYRYEGIGVGQVGLFETGRSKAYESDPFGAAEQVFGLSTGEALYVFAPSDGGEHKATPKRVATKIERFVESGHRIPRPRTF